MRLTRPTVRLWPVERLEAHPRNYRHHPAEQIAALAASLRRFGWAKASISARPSDGLLWTGHGVLAAAKSLGLTRVPVVEREMTDAEGAAWLVADNELSRPGLVVDDGAALAALLDDVATTDDGLDGTGHSADSLAELLAALEPAAPTCTLHRIAAVESCDTCGAERGDDCRSGDADVQRHKTAITRQALSSPLAALDGLGYLDGTKTLFDYGCGKGDDLVHLAERGVNASGCDPHWQPDEPRKPADLVNLGFVLDVIEDPAERADTLRQAFGLAQELLIVAVQVGKPPAQATPCGDGVRTSIGTFQRYYGQAEVAAYVADQLADQAFATESLGSGLVVAFPTAVGHAAFLERQYSAGVTFQDDPALELVKSWGVAEGQTWQLGEHRMYVGDVLVEGVIPVLSQQEQRGPVDAVITDPPFAIYGSSTGIGADIADDRMVRPFFELALGRARDAVKWFGHVWLCTDWRSWASVWEAARRVRLHTANCFVWDKGNGGLGSMGANCHEFVGFFVKVPPPAAMRSSTKRGHRTVYKSNILRHNRAHGAERLHNAAKPVALVTELVEAATEPGERVLDPFCGSGSTLIACERAGRICYTADAEPRWAAVTLQRWADETGRKPELVTT